MVTWYRMESREELSLRLTSLPASAPGTFHSTVCAVLNLAAT